MAKNEIMDNYYQERLRTIKSEYSVLCEKECVSKIDFALPEIKKIAQYYKRSMIKKSEYNRLMKVIESFMFE